MIEEKNNVIWLKCNGLIRSFIVHFGCNSIFNYLLVNEYPKSGGTWLGQMLAELNDIPFPRNRLPYLKPSIIHGHHLNSFNINKAVVMWRDGRDVLVSQYYHYLFKNELSNQYVVDRTRTDLKFNDYNDIKTNLPQFMEYVYEVKKHPKFSWSEFVNKWVNIEEVVHVKYEELRLKTVEELQRIFFELKGIPLNPDLSKKISNKYSFETQSQRKSGEERKNSFMRKGIVGDWENSFSQDAKELFSEYAGKELIKLGYEKDFLWVKNENKSCKYN